MPKGNLTRASIKSLRQRCQNYLVSNLNSLLGKFPVLNFRLNSLLGKFPVLSQNGNFGHQAGPKAKKRWGKRTRHLIKKLNGCVTHIKA